MSIEAIAWALKQHTGSPTLKGVLVAVANYADDEWKCWPKQETIAHLMEMSEKTVMRALKSLEEKGFISRQDRFHEGKRISDMIRLHHHRTESPMAQTDSLSLARGLSVPKPPDRESDKPSLEPSVESFMRSSRKKIGIEDFRLDGPAVAVAQSLGLSDEQIDGQETRFRSYNATSNPQTYAQWCIHWQTWCEKFSGKHGLKPKADTSTEVIREGVMLNQLTDQADWEAWEEYHGRRLPAGKTGSRWFPSRRPPAKAAAE